MNRISNYFLWNKPENPFQTSYDVAISLFKPIYLDSSTLLECVSAYTRLSESIQANSIRIKPIWVDLSQFESIWVDLSQFESIWVDLSHSESIRVDLNQFKLIQSDSSQFQSIWVNFSQFETIWVDLSRFESISYWFNFYLLRSLRNFNIFVNIVYGCPLQ